MERAYILESVEAKYPRILIGETLWGFLQSALAEFKKGHIQNHKVLVALIEKSIGYIGTDTDGKRILDYLQVLSVLTEDLQKEKMVIPAYDFVVSEHKRHVDEGNEKLAHRYADFKNYFESRLSLWGIPPNKS